MTAVKEIQFNPHLGDLTIFVEKNKRLVHKVCQRYKNNITKYGCEYEDLYNLGMIGLLKAYEKFDPTKFENVTRFSTYGFPMILGEIQKFIRDNNAGPKYPRSVKQLAIKINQLDFINEKPENIAAFLECEVEMVLDALEFIKGTTSINNIVFENDGDPITLEDQIQSNTDFTMISTEDFLSTLKPQWRKAIELRMDGFGQVEIGKAIGVSQVQVSRIIQKVGSLYLNYIGDNRTFKEFKKEIMEANKMARTAKGNLGKAKELLSNTDLTVWEVAKQSGCNYMTVRNWANKIRKIEDTPKSDVIPEAPTKTYYVPLENPKKIDTAPIMESDMEEGLNIEKEESVSIKNDDSVKNPAMVSDLYMNFSKENITVEEFIPELSKVIEILKITRKERISFDLTIK